MKSKNFVIIFCMVLVVASTFSAVGIKIEKKDYEDQPSYPIPGDMNGDTLPQKPALTKTAQTHKKTVTKVSTQDNIISIIQQIDEDLFLGFLEELTSFGPRVTDTEACFDSADYIYNEFVDMGLETRYQEWSDQGSTNIEATIYGTDSASDEIYIICAHYDSVPGSPGADDDGSGVAAVLSAAKVLSNYNPINTIRFVTFSGEEQGLLGSYYYVTEALEDEENIIAVLNVDMIGYAETEEDENNLKIYHNDDSQWLVDYTIDVSDTYNNLIALNVIPSGYSWGSDHYYFWEAGYDAIFYAEYNFNDYYHSPEDTIEHMNLGYATKNTKLIVATLASLIGVQGSEAPYKPQTPKGTINGKFSVPYNYETVTTDPQDDVIYYKWSWGNSESEWLGPHYSGETVNATHVWDEKGTYAIKVKAKDDPNNDGDLSDGHESEWSDPLTVSMPKLRINILQNLFEKYVNDLYKLLSVVYNRIVKI